MTSYYNRYLLPGCFLVSPGFLFEQTDIFSDSKYQKIKKKEERRKKQ